MYKQKQTLKQACWITYSETVYRIGLHRQNKRNHINKSNKLAQINASAIVQFCIMIRFNSGYKQNIIKCIAPFSLK